MKALAGLCSGLIFGFGLAVSGMTDTNKVLGFLDVFGAWQAPLLLVMGSAVLVTLIGFPLLKRRARPFLAASFQFPQRTDLDRRLLLGATLFGVGWGLYGYCPGPALAGVIYGSVDTVLFLMAMVFGMAVATYLTRNAP